MCVPGFDEANTEIGAVVTVGEEGNMDPERIPACCDGRWCGKMAGEVAGGVTAKEGVGGFELLGEGESTIHMLVKLAGA